MRWRLRVTLLVGGNLLAAAEPHAAPTAPPRLVRVDLDSRVTLETVQRSGLDVINVRPGSHVMILEWPGDASRLEALGAHSTVIDENPGRTAALRSRAELRSRPVARGSNVLSAARTDGVFRTEVLPPSAPAPWAASGRSPRSR